MSRVDLPGAHAHPMQTLHEQSVKFAVTWTVGNNRPRRSQASEIHTFREQRQPCPFSSHRYVPDGSSLRS